MASYEVGDTLVHSTFGSGMVAAVTDKGLPGSPRLYYEIETGELTLWAPVEEAGGSSLHRLSTGVEFQALLQLLRSPSEKMSNNPFQRHNQLSRRMEKASAQDLCLVIRDLTHRSHSRKLSDNDTRVLKQAQSSLLDEWTISRGVTREDARGELESILKDLQRTKYRRVAPDLPQRIGPTVEYLGQYML